MENVPRKHKGQRSKGGHQQPHQRHGSKAVLGVKGGALRLSEAQKCAANYQRRHGDQPRHGRFPVQQRHGQRQGQKSRLHQQDSSQHKADHAYIHSASSYSCRKIS